MHTGVHVEDVRRRLACVSTSSILAGALHITTRLLCPKQTAAGWIPPCGPPGGFGPHGCLKTTRVTQTKRKPRRDFTSPPARSCVGFPSAAVTSRLPPVSDVNVKKERALRAARANSVHVPAGRSHWAERGSHQSKLTLHMDWNSRLSERCVVGPYKEDPSSSRCVDNARGERRSEETSLAAEL